MRKPINVLPSRVITENGEKALADLTEEEHERLLQAASTAISEALSDYYSELQNSGKG